MITLDSLFKASQRPSSSQLPRALRTTELMCIQKGAVLSPVVSARHAVGGEAKYLAGVTSITQWIFPREYLYACPPDWSGSFFSPVIIRLSPFVEDLLQGAEYHGMIVELNEIHPF